MKPNRILESPDLLETLINEYFLLGEAEGVDVTVPGLALHTGFSTSRELINTAIDYSKPQSDDYQQSQTLLQRALTFIESYYVQNGLRERTNASFTKFTLSVYHDLNEKTESKEVRENKFEIVWQSNNPLQPTAIGTIDVPQLEAKRAAHRQLEHQVSNEALARLRSSLPEGLRELV